MRPAASYIRMSRELQKYSAEMQRLALSAYAQAHDYEIVREYFDAGISGLRLATRPALKQMLSDATSPAPGFATILVYDVSRWGRFQDPDESAHYEFICKQAGIPVVYCAEPFNDDGSLVSSLVKHLKRGMAAEFSRELSIKVSLAQEGLAKRGFWTGGPPGYGLRRVAVTAGMTHLLQMNAGEQLALRGYRTRLIPGPAAEVQVVRRIYKLFVVGKMTPTAISHLLNREGVVAEGGVPWSQPRVSQLLSNEKYAGSFYCRKSTGRLGDRHRLPPAKWVRVPGSVEPIVTMARFEAAQRRRVRMPRNPTDEQVLAGLRLVLRDYGSVCYRSIKAHPDCYSGSTICKRFGGVIPALALIGERPSAIQLAGLVKFRRSNPIDPAEALEGLHIHFARLGFITGDSIDADRTLPSPSYYRRKFGGMRAIYAFVGHVPTAAQKRYLK